MFGSKFSESNNKSIDHLTVCNLNLQWKYGGGYVGAALNLNVEISSGIYRLFEINFSFV
jgi:hypothetical protein